MVQLINYVKRGKGRGLLFVLAAAALISIAFSFAGRYYYSKTRPQIMLITEDFLPLTIEKGKIISPINAYKETIINFGGTDNEFLIALDTREENLTSLANKQGVFVMRDKISVVSEGRILHTYYMEDGVWDKDRFNAFLDGLVNNTLNYVAVIYTAILFVLYLFLTFVVSVLALLGTKMMQKEEIFDFSALMRFSSMLVFALEITSFCLLVFFKISVSEVQICFMAALVEWFFINREKETEV